MIGHIRGSAGLPRTAVLIAVVLGSMVVAPSPLHAVDPTAAPPTRGEMFRQPPATPGTPPRAPQAAAAVIGPSGFHDTALFSGLFHPTAVAFADDGRVFVAEKRGVVQVFDSIADPVGTVYADLQTQVYDYWDRGLLGMTLDPNFATNGRVYVLYTYNHILGDPAPAPRWVDGMGNDACPDPPGNTKDGCVASARLQRLETNGGGTWDGIEHVLVEDWCQVHPSHSIGTVMFGPDGALYAGSGEGASFVATDYGQDFRTEDDITPDNPCGDPPSPKGTALSPPTAEGGSLRAQDIRTSGDPTGLSGSIIRVDPTTGAGKPDNFNFNPASPKANLGRIVAFGLRNPFRFTFRPGTNELWIGDVGHVTWEEFDRVISPTAAPRNFGWPCYEGAARKSQFDQLNLTICENLYASGTAQSPYYVYNHSDRVVPGDACPSGLIGGSVISGAAFYPTSGGTFPDAYDGALFFADYARNCIWAMPAKAGGLPDTTKIETFASGLGGPVDLTIGPDGALYYAGFDDNKIHRIAVGPTAVATAAPTQGMAPLFVQFNGSQSNDPKGGALTYAWDLDGDGQFDDSTETSPTWTYQDDGTYLARLRVTDTELAQDIDEVTITVGNHPPVASITSPSSSLTWSVGDTISFSGSATDQEDGTEPGNRLSWSVLIQHCPDACHSHTIQTSTGFGGSLPAPDHGYPSSLEFRLVATDANGTASAPVSVTILPKTVDMSFESRPPGVQLSVGETTAAAPFSETFINKATVQVSAPPTATIGGRPYAFAGWSDGGAPSHSLTARTSRPSLVATYAPATTYVPIAPVRVVDTRGSSAGPIAAGGTRSFAVGGTPGIPSNAVAVTGNLTAVGPTRAGWIGLTTSPAIEPTTSAINFPAGDTRANGVTVLLGTDGRLAATYQAASGSTHLLLDVTGYFVAADTGATFSSLGPTRVLDSRDGTGGYSSPFVSGIPRSLLLRGVAGIPSDAIAVTGNLAVTGQTAGGYVSMTTAASSAPAVSTINMPVGDTRANGLTIKLNGSGRANLVYVGGEPGVATADLLFDVTGYYRPGLGGWRFYPVEPRRIFDTRSTDPPALTADLPRTINVVTVAAIPDGIEAVATNVTVVGQTAAGYVSITTLVTNSPTTSTINFPLGDIRANNTLNALDSNGRFRAIYKAAAGKTTQLIVDLAGYFR